MLSYFFQAFENTLKSWEDKQKCELPRPPSFSLHPEIISEEESTHINQFCRAAGALIHRWDKLPWLGSSELNQAVTLDIYHTVFFCPLCSIQEIAQSYQDMEQELAHAVNASSKSMDRVYAKSKSTEVLPCLSLFSSMLSLLCRALLTALCCFTLICIFQPLSICSFHRG